MPNQLNRTLPTPPKSAESKVLVRDEVLARATASRSASEQAVVQLRKTASTMAANAANAEDIDDMWDNVPV